MTLHVFGIRHHGPGCARSLLAALRALQPDVVLIEGPPDAADVLQHAADEGMQPPVALLVYPLDGPSDCLFYPFATFSPEWQALQYAHHAKVPARFMDLPVSHMLALRKARRLEVREQIEAAGPPDDYDPDDGPDDGPDDDIALPDLPPSKHQPLRDDPIGALARAAGYDDHELWWEHQIEQRLDSTELFNGILEAMAAVREHRAGDADDDAAENALREAWMRQTIRAAQKEGFQRIAIVCGAWHAPALHAPGPAKPDTELLKGLEKRKVAATWIPWTHSRLAYRSGYGAGIHSPGWYAHLWTAPDRAGMRWVASAARLLRERDLDAPAASVIEAVRLADALAAMRNLPMPGLGELTDAMQTVLCHGDTAPMQLIANELQIGDALGEVPEGVPIVPLQRDLNAAQTRLRLKPAVMKERKELDLRKDTDRERSHLLHRLNLLDVPWGVAEDVHGKSGSFHEHWTLDWDPQFAVALIEASVFGHTVESAASGKVRERAAGAATLVQLTSLLDQAILAALGTAIDDVLKHLQAKAAVASDTLHLMEAIPPLARVARYGDVRGTNADHVLPVLDGLIERVVIGLPGACGSLDDDAARAMVARISGVNDSVATLDNADWTVDWIAAVQSLADDDGVHGLVRGVACRLLVDRHQLTDDDLMRRALFELTPASDPMQATAWLEGLLRGSGLVMLHKDGLWSALDAWVRAMSDESFETMVPLLRRAFSGFSAPERAKMGAKARHITPPTATPPATRPVSKNAAPPIAPDLDPERARRVLPVLATILGVTLDAE
ncbi:MAG: DUF5682 family protein [Planctomycetota bacterium]